MSASQVATMKPYLRPTSGSLRQSFSSSLLSSNSASKRNGTRTVTPWGTSVNRVPVSKLRRLAAERKNEEEAKRIRDEENDKAGRALVAELRKHKR